MGALRRNPFPQAPARRPRRMLAVCAAAAGALVFSVSAPAQTAPAVLDLIVIDAASALPVGGARVAIGTAMASTDSTGAVRFVLRDPQEVEVRIQALGYDARSLTLDVPGGQTFQLTVPLDLAPVFLPGVRVDGGEMREPRSRELQEFYRRVRVGPGQYLTRQDIERRQLRDLEDLIRTLPGFSLLNTPAGNKPILESKTSASAELFEREADCPIQYFLDGSPMTPIHDGVLDAEVELNEVEGIEIYRRGSSVPAKFHRFNNTCGVILIWKKERI